MTETVEPTPITLESAVSRLSEVRDIVTREIADFGHRVRVVGEDPAEQERVPDRFDCDYCYAPKTPNHPTEYGRCIHQAAFEALYEILGFVSVPETEKTMLVDEEALAVEEVWEADERVRQAEATRKANL